MFCFTGMFKHLVIIASVTTFVCVTHFITSENIFYTVTLDRSIKNANATGTEAKDLNTSVVTGEDPNTLVITTADANTSLIVKDAKMPKSKIVSSKNIRFAVAYYYYEQQTNALLNMWSMQKWAKLMGFKVLEPFAQQSTLGFSSEILKDCNFTNTLRFRDYFDFDFWTNMSKERYEIPPLEKWETFVLSPLKKTVVVILAYEVHPGGQYVDNDINKHQGCVKQREGFYNLHAKLFYKLQIQVVRNVCFAFNYKSISLHLFNSLIFPDGIVNVWFSTWRGIQGGGRIPIYDHHEIHRGYGGLSNILTMAKSSPRILRDSRKYVNTILNADFKEYTAVAFRTGMRKNKLISHGYERKEVMEFFRKCAIEVHSALLKIPSSAIFAAIDLGRFGDLSSHEGYFKINNDGAKLFQFILNNIYGNKSIGDYENELIRAANGIEDSGYIGSMQKTIAENAKHLIMVGGYSNFQRSMVGTFTKANQNCQDCVTYICYH